MIKKIFKNLAVFLVVTGILFSNIPYWALTEALDSYIAGRNIVDKARHLSKDKNVVDKFTSYRNLAEKIKVHEARAAAPTVVNKGTIGQGTGTSVSPAYPASVSANDIIFILAISNQPNGIGVINTPAGFTEVAQGTYQNSSALNRGRAALFWQRAAGGESGTVAVSRTGDTGTDGSFLSQMYRVSGAETSGNPWDAVTARYGPGNATVTWNAVTVSGSERTLLGFAAQADNASTVDPPTGWSGLATDVTAQGTDAELRLLYLANVSSDGVVTATGGETEGWATFHIPMKPPANTAPTLTVTQPDGVGDTVTVGASYNITYDLSDPEQVVTVDFYYDTDAAGLDGTAITGCVNQPEGTGATCAWDTTGVTPGSYFVYGRDVLDGIAPEVSDYSPGQITINAPAGPDATSYTNGSEAALNFSACATTGCGARVTTGTSQTIEVTGTAFGTVATTSMATCGGGAGTGCVRIADFTIPTTSFVAWTDTLIRFRVPLSVTVFGGAGTTCGTAGANGVCVTAAGANDTSGALQFFVFPDITSVSPSGAGEGREGASVTITGNRFDTSAATGTVDFYNCTATSTASIVGWGDTSIAVTVPSTITDTDDSCDVLVTRAAGTGSKNARSLGFVVLPDITGMASIATNAAREYAAGVDTDGLAQLNGNHFGTATGTAAFTGNFGSVSATVHTAVEGSCTVSGWAVAATSACIEVSTAIVDTVATGTITLTRTGDSKTDVIDFRALPRITTTTPASGIVGDLIQLAGNHFCQASACPASGNRSNASNNVKFGATQAAEADFVNQTGGAGACNGAGAAWTNTEICVRVPTGTPTGSQPTQITSTDGATYTSNSKAFTVASTVPNAPTNLEQRKSDGITLIAVGDGTDGTTVVLEGDISAGTSITMKLDLEVATTGAAFTGAITASSTSFTGTSFANVTTTVPGLANGSEYHWRARTRNVNTSETSAWAAFGSNPSGDGSTDGSPANRDFYVDTSAPGISIGTPPSCTAHSSVTDTGATISWTVGGETFYPASTTNQVRYGTDSTLVTGSTVSASSGTNPGTNLSGLSASTAYYYWVKSTDAVGNPTQNPASSPFCSFTTSAAVTRIMKTVEYFMVQRDQITSSGTSTSTFPLYISESTVTLRKVYAELTGVMIGTGGSSPTVGVLVNNVNNGTPLTVNLPNTTTAQAFKIRYNLPNPNLNCTLPVENNFAICADGVNSNTLYLTFGGGFSKVSLINAKMIITYYYTP